MNEQERPEPPQVADEKATLVGFLEFQRATLEWKCSGLTAEQLARRAVPPSTMSLLGLVRHLAEVEWAWFDRVDTGVRRPPVYFSDADPDGDFNGAVAEQACVDDAFASWQRAVEQSRAVTDRTPIDATFEHERHGTTTFRWVLAHMIEEYARHNGHADLLRQLIDGATGE